MEGNGIVKGQTHETFADDLPVTAESLVGRRFPEINPRFSYESLDFSLTLSTASTIEKYLQT
jgi:hypothetical protein